MNPRVDRGSRRLLLVSHGPLVETGGGSARWRSLVRHLAHVGWEVDVVSAPIARSADPFARHQQTGRSMAVRARMMSRLRRLTEPIWRFAGIQPLPLSTLWIPRGAREVRRRLCERRYDVVLATGPQMAALPAARLGIIGSSVPFVVEFRDLWAGNPAYDRGGPLLAALERSVLARARGVVAVTPQAMADLQARHPSIARLVEQVPNGFEPELLEWRRDREPCVPLTLVHSGTLIPQRPVAPLLNVLREEPYRSAFRLVLHGYAAPEIQDEIAASGGGCDVQLVPPSSWRDAICRVAGADAALVTQGRGAGDAHAIAAKVYEYLALGKPVLCITDGGATEMLVKRLCGDELCARLGSPDSIRRALDRLMRPPAPAPVPPELLEPYSRRFIAAQMATLLERAAAG